MRQPPRVIINADDFGLSSSVNEAVFEAFDKGILSSASIMANMPGFMEGALGARTRPYLGVGVHLNLFRGSPVCNPRDVPSLVGPDGCFTRSMVTLWKRFRMGAVKDDHVVREWEAQIERVIEQGISPTHLDSEKHLHLVFPFLGETVCRLAVRYSIPCVRVARETLWTHSLPRRPALRQLLKAAVIRRRSEVFARVAQRYALRSTDRFFGVALTGRMTAEVYQILFTSLVEGSIEIMCHPAERAEDATSFDSQRVDEYHALLDPRPKDALNASGASLIHYGEL